MRFPLTLLALACAAAIAAAEKRDAVDVAADDGLNAYERAVAADAVGDAPEAARQLKIARARLDVAIRGLERQLERDPSSDDIFRRLQEALKAGHACCGRTSLWKRYGIPEEPRGPQTEMAEIEPQPRR